MFQKESEWVTRFDRRFEGYWRGQAVPDEIKFFIQETLSQREKEIAEEVEKALEKHFEGFECGHNGLKENILAIINNKSL